MVLVTFRVPGVARYTLTRFTGTTLPPGTVTVRRLPITCTLTSSVAPSAVSVTVHTDAGRDPVEAARHAARPGPRGDHEVWRQRGAVAGHADGDWSLAAGERAGDGLADEQGAARRRFDARRRAERRGVAVADVHFDDVTGRDGGCLPAPVDDDRHRAGVPVSGLRDGALRRSFDLIVLLGLVARGSPGGDHEVRGQGLAIAHRVDPDLPLLARTGTGDRLPHEQRADEVDRYR